MPFRFMQLADPQFGMFREFSAMAPDRRQELYRRLRPAFLPPGVEPEVPDGVTDLTPELQRFGAAIETANAERPRFVVVCGDLVNNVDRPDQWEALADTATGLDDDIPMRWLPGNHDLAEDFMVPTPDGLSAYRARFGDDYYTFQEDNVLFLALNSETLSRPDHMPHEADRQFEFLADTLHSRAAREAAHIVAFTHTPLFLADPATDGAGAISLDNRLRLLKLFREHAVGWVFSGHLHQNREVEVPGVRQVVNGPVGLPFVGRSGYRLVEVSDGAITHRYHAFDSE